MAFALDDLSSVSGVSHYVLSADGELSIGGEKLGGYKSGTLSFSATNIDNSTRDDQGWTAAAPGMRSCQLQVTFNKLAADACQTGIRGWVLNADFLTKGVAVKWLDATGGAGFTGEFTLSDYSETAVADGTAIECSLTLNNYGGITAVTA